MHFQWLYRIKWAFCCSDNNKLRMLDTKRASNEYCYYFSSSIFFLRIFSVKTIRSMCVPWAPHTHTCSLKLINLNELGRIYTSIVGTLIIHRISTSWDFIFQERYQQMKMKTWNNITYEISDKKSGMNATHVEKYTLAIVQISASEQLYAAINRGQAIHYSKMLRARCKTNNTWITNPKCAHERQINYKIQQNHKIKTIIGINAQLARPDRILHFDSI